VSEFHYQPIFEYGESEIPFRKLTSEHVSTAQFEGTTVLKVEPEALTLLAREAMRDVSFLLRPRHLGQLSAILEDPEASDNDRFVALELLKNANVAAGMVLPGCQDTGTAIVVAKKGQNVFTGGGDAQALARGIHQTFAKENLRYSQNAPLTMYEEKNTGSNLPAQIDIAATDGDEYEFLFITKGGGSANKTFLFQETKALLNPESLKRFFSEKIKLLGTAACPPYHLAIVVGGTSAEATLKTVKLASCHYLDDLPTAGNEHGRAFRDPELEEQLLAITREVGIGAQFGGKYFCHDVRAIRLPRHGASCPVGIGVSCSADRQSVGRSAAEGVGREQRETEPARFLTGTLVVARDSAHAKLKERLDRGEGLPDYFKNHMVYYAGPAKTPEGYVSGSFGPTTAGRMDSYVDLFMKNGGSFVTLAKGNRSKAVTEACEKYGGFYLGSVGGPAAILAQDCIKKVEVLEYEELGMEAIWKIEVENFPAFVIVDDKGNDFFADL